MSGALLPGSQADQLRRLVAPSALVVLLVAALTDPAPAADIVLGAAAVAALAAWAYVPNVPLSVIALVVLPAVALAQRSGALEPLMFEACLLAIVAGRAASRAGAAVGVLAVAEPALVALLQDHPDFSVGIWTLAIAFSWCVARAVARQEQLAAELDASRRELEHQALLEERRRIARDVHDFVGHGLAAVMLHVTGARHVLARDPASAAEALASAEEIGRRSMQELRRTVALLRDEDELPTSAPLPSATGIPSLIDDARAGGLAVELQTRGDLSAVGQSTGVALYRIAQEALANAARHAPHARTVVGVDITDGHASLAAETIGVTAAPPGDAPRRGYGLIGMRERATALGGAFSAGPTADGWRLQCRLPLDADDESPGRGR